MEFKDSTTVPAVRIFLLLAIVLVFGQTIMHEFVNYDDGPYVYQNRLIAEGLTVHGVMWAVTSAHASNWHPLTWISHMLDVQLYGLHPGGHHLTSILLHAVAAILLFQVLLRMTGALWRSAFVAVVFAIHPLRVESVAWVAERKDVLSGLFFMLTLWVYVGYASRPFSLNRYLTVVAVFAFGLMAKPMLVTLPFVLLLLDYWPLERFKTKADGSFSSFRRMVVEKLPLLVLAGGSCVATFFAQGKSVVPIDAIPISSRIANALVSYIFYLGKLFYPVGLALFYPHPWEGLPIWKIVSCSLALVAITTAALTRRRQLPYLFVGWFWYIGMMMPVIGLVQVGEHSMADRYTYLPQIGLGLAMTWGVAQLTASWRHRHLVLGVTSMLVVLVLMGFAWRQVSYWRNSETLWTHTLDSTSKNYVAHNNLGNALTGRGHIQEAVFHYRKALGIRPDYPDTHNNLGNVLTRCGQIKEAISHYKRAIEIRPAYAEAHYNFGNALAKQTQMESAIVHYRKALEIRPDYVDSHNNLGIALAGLGQLDEAISHFRKALEIKPDDTVARDNLNLALRQLNSHH